jgi:hypothetical protein
MKTAIYEGEGSHSEFFIVLKPGGVLSLLPKADTVINSPAVLPQTAQVL